MAVSLFNSRWSFTTILLSTLISPSYQISIGTRQSGLQWGACDPELGSDGTVCANFTVPLDWTNPSNGQSARLYVAKLPARNGSPLGTIFTNPGGPGGLGSTFIHGDSGEKAMNITGGFFDIVSWDPRGIGFSSPAIKYHDIDPDQLHIADIVAVDENLLSGALNAQSTGPTQADIDLFLANATNAETYFKSFVQKSVDKNGDNLKYVGSVATVRDLVALADAIEGPGRPIRYWGFSYGTLIGSYLLDLFPDRVGRIVLDGILDAETYSQRVPYLAYSDGFGDFDGALQAFLDACAASGPSVCRIATPGSTGASLRQWANGLIDTAYRAVQTNTSNTDSGNLTPTLVRAQLAFAAKAPELWDIIADALATIYGGLHGGSGVNARSINHSNKFDRRSSLRARSTQYGLLDTYPTAYYAISCGDSIDSSNVTTTDVFKEIVRITKEVSNIPGPLEIASSSSWCHLWPARAVERHPVPGIPKLPNQILIVSNTYDPPTPLSSAFKLRDRLNSGGSRQAALIQNDGAGHLAFSVDSACTYDIIKRYFVEGVVPEDTLCGTNFRGFVGDPFGDRTNRSTSTSIISAPLPDSTGAVKNGATATNQRSFLATVLWSAICVLFSSVVSVQLHYL